MSRTIFKDDDPVVCWQCSNVIYAGMRYVSYKKYDFCNTDCLGQYLVEHTEYSEEYLETADDKAMEHSERYGE